jgi:hypothetical protein
MAKSEEISLANTKKIMQENVVLLAEINDLRRELTVSKGAVSTLEATVRTTKKLMQMRGQSLSNAALQPDEAPSLADTMSKQHVDRVIEMQKDEIRRLRDQLETSRPPSTGRLPSLTATTS